MNRKIDAKIVTVARTMGPVMVGILCAAVFLGLFVGFLIVDAIKSDGERNNARHTTLPQ